MNLSLNKLPWHGQLGVFAGLALAGIGVFYQFYVTPFSAEMAVRTQQLEALQADIARGQIMATKVSGYGKEVGILETRLETLRAVLPEQKDVADLLRRIQTLATQSNLTIRGFKPAPTVTRELHAEWPIALLLDGTYHNLGMFFDRVSKFSRIININGVTITAKDKQVENSTIIAECVATTFVLLETPAAAAPGAAAAKTN